FACHDSAGFSERMPALFEVALCVELLEPGGPRLEMPLHFIRRSRREPPAKEVREFAHGSVPVCVQLPLRPIFHLSDQMEDLCRPNTRSLGGRSHSRTIPPHQPIT